jgi:hypothetical protein
MVYDGVRWWLCQSVRDSRATLNFACVGLTVTACPATQDVGYLYVSTADYSNAATPRGDPLSLTAGVTFELPLDVGAGGPESTTPLAAAAAAARRDGGTVSRAGAGSRPASSARAPSGGGATAQFSGERTLAAPALPSRVTWVPHSPAEASQVARARSHWRLGGSPPRNMTPVVEVQQAAAPDASMQNIAADDAAAAAAAPPYLVSGSAQATPAPPPKRPPTTRVRSSRTAATAPCALLCGAHSRARCAAQPARARLAVRDRAAHTTVPSPRRGRLAFDEVDEIRAAAAVSPRQPPPSATSVGGGGTVKVKAPGAVR